MALMQLITGDLREQHQQGHVIAVTRGGLVGKGGPCAMPSGTAKQAAQKFPHLPYILGDQIKKFGIHVFDLGNRIVSFPVESSRFENPDLSIIDRSCKELVALTIDKGWQHVVVPRPGCGQGVLQWNDVQPILEQQFNSRFHIIDGGYKYETS